MKIKYKLISLFFRQKTKDECHKVLLTNNTYYQNLSENNKNTFQIRTLLFLWTTNFSSDAGFSLNQKMKIIISSAFVQITFGLKTDTLEKFNDIFVTPRAYSYKNHSTIFDGDVNPNTKKINMSWPAIEQGFEISDDALKSDILSNKKIINCLEGNTIERIIIIPKKVVNLIASSTQNKNN